MEGKGRRESGKAPCGSHVIMALNFNGNDGVNLMWCPSSLHSACPLERENGEEREAKNDKDILKGTES